MILSKKIDSAHQSFLQWRDIPFSTKQKYLTKLADVLEKNAEKFEIQLVNPQQIQNQTLLSLSLPPQKTIDTLTAFALKTQ